MKDGAREVEGGRGQEGRECTDESVMDQRKFQNELDMKERRENTNNGKKTLIRRGGGGQQVAFDHSIGGRDCEVELEGVHYNHFVVFELLFGVGVARQVDDF